MDNKIEKSLGTK